MTAKLRNRVKEMRLVRVADLIGMEQNFREHPESQMDAVQGSLNELGFLDPIDCWEDASGQLHIFDGHLRKNLVSVNIDPETLVPCNVTDLTEDEAKKALLVKDGLAGMAEINEEMLADLISQVQIDDAALAEMVASMASEEAELPPDAEPEAETATDTKQPVIAECFQILVTCINETEQGKLLQEFTERGLTVRSLIV